MTQPPRYRVEGITIGDALTSAISYLSTGEVAGARLDAQLLMAHVIGQDRAWLLAHTDNIMPEEARRPFTAFINRRAAHEPVVHITGTREFYGLNFYVTPDVLTPRVETEQMVEWASRYAPQASKLLDVGTGSGAIAVAIAMYRPDLTVTASEVSETALMVARRNVARHRVSVQLVAADLWASLPNEPILTKFDTVVTNLPYLRDDAHTELMPEVQREPAVALFGGEDGLNLYRRFLAGLPAHLEPGGYLFTECDPWQHEALIAEAARYGLKPIEQGYFILGFRAASTV